MPATLTIPVPRDYLLLRDACSYGYFLLEPTFWDPRLRTLRRVMSLPGGAASLTIRQDGRKGSPLQAVADRRLSKADEREALRQISRMLRLDEDHLHVREFHRLDARWKRSGRARLFRSPTLFEDVIKTVTSCNVTWPSTVSMNRRLCEAFGEKSPSGRPAFPTPQILARQRANTLRARCGVGYRDARIVELARMFVREELDPAWFEDPLTPDEAIRERLIELPGIGPYAAANILQLLGRYGHLPLDTESVRHGKSVLGFRGSSRAVMNRVQKHFEPFGRHKFRSYWFEMWCFYESKRGQAHTWDRETTGSSFTASKL
jgi:3-methyladenine DNA glycosylase/8-oxoguanine DNA glycosylase